MLQWLIEWIKILGDRFFKRKNDNSIIMFLNDNGACAENDMLGSGP